MAEIRRERLTAEIEGEFCVFLVGMRVNRWWKVHRWWPVAMAMPRLLRELYSDRDLGFLGGEMWFGNPTISVQYWKSFDHLERYAKATDRLHRPAWHAFNQIARSGDVGVWHEAYVIRPGEYECIYNNLPPFGLGKVSRLVPATGRRESAASRLHSGA